MSEGYGYQYPEWLAYFTGLRADAEGIVNMEAPAEDTQHNYVLREAPGAARDAFLKAAAGDETGWDTGAAMTEVKPEAANRGRAMLRNVGEAPSLTSVNLTW